MNTLNGILPLGLLVGALCALGFAFSRPVSLLPRWVRHAYLLLSIGMTAWAIGSYIQTQHRSTLSEHTYSLVLQGKAWLAGFSGGVLIVLILAGVFPKILGRSESNERQPND